MFVAVVSDGGEVCVHEVKKWILPLSCFLSLNLESSSPELATGGTCGMKDLFAAGFNAAIIIVG